VTTERRTIIRLVGYDSNFGASRSRRSIQKRDATRSRRCCSRPVPRGPTPFACTRWTQANIARVEIEALKPERSPPSPGASALRLERPATHESRRSPRFLSAREAETTCPRADGPVKAGAAGVRRTSGGRDGRSTCRAHCVPVSISSSGRARATDACAPIDDAVIATPTRRGSSGPKDPRRPRGALCGRTSISTRTMNERIYALSA